MQKAHVPCFTWKAPISQIAAKKARYCWSKWILLEPWPNLRWWFIPAFFSQAGRVKRTSKDRQQFYRFPWFCVIYTQLINSEWFFYSVLGWVTGDFSTRQGTFCALPSAVDATKCTTSRILRVLHFWLPEKDQSYYKRNTFQEGLRL